MLSGVKTRNLVLHDTFHCHQLQAIVLLTRITWALTLTGGRLLVVEGFQGADQLLGDIFVVDGQSLLLGTCLLDVAVIL